jgi:hypothetical protein
MQALQRPKHLRNPEHLIRACPVLINRRREIFELVSLETIFEWSIWQLKRYIEGSVVGELLKRTDL